jgi:hypothetical protein
VVWTEESRRQAALQSDLPARMMAAGAADQVNLGGRELSSKRFEDGPQQETLNVRLTQERQSRGSPLLAYVRHAIDAVRGVWSR